MRKYPKKILYKLLSAALPVMLCSGQITALDKEIIRDNKIFLTTGLVIRKAVDVNATLDNAWEAWTTDEGVRSFFCPRFQDRTRGRR